MQSLFEKVILGGLLNKPSLITYVVSVLSSVHFSTLKNSIIYSCICYIYQFYGFIDLSVLLDFVLNYGVHISCSYLLSLYAFKCSLSDIRTYISIVLRNSLFNRLRFNISLLKTFLNSRCFFNTSVLVSKLQLNINLLVQQAITVPVNCALKVKGFLSAIISGTLGCGFITGFVSLDTLLSIKLGDLVIVAGRPATGKTTFCLDILRFNALNLNKCVCMFSLEMTANQLLIKLVSAITSLESDLILRSKCNSKVFKQVVSACKLLSGASICINDTPQIGIVDICNYLRALKSALKSEILVVIDYVQLITAHTVAGDIVTDIGGFSSILKQVARELGLVIILVSQLNRRVEYRQDKVPMLSDLRESGSLEQDADLILFISPLLKVGMCEHVRVFISKNRCGSTGVVNLKFLKHYSRFVV